MPAADDWHIHLRNDDRTPASIRAVRTGGSARVLAMPNTKPAISTAEEALAYRAKLVELGADFDVQLTIKLTPDTTPDQVREAAAKSVRAAKQYPDGVTTNSENGVRDVRSLFPVYEAMQDADLVLCIHGEEPTSFVLDAELDFLSSLQLIHENFPRLRMVLEHITTRAAVEMVAGMPEHVAATITDHHLILTLGDVVGTRIRPHNFCMPVAKRPEDRAALNEIVKRGHPSFFSGTDSAPHAKVDKECDCGAAGIFNSGYHMQFLATHFEREGMLDRLEDFTSRFGADFYRVPRNREEITLVREPTPVPAIDDGIVPFNGGSTLDWQVVWN